jgi:4'-phosphopantetheinyl transferase
LARRFFSPAECALLDRSDEHSYSRRWHRIWTTREAHAKAAGIGVRALAALPEDRGYSWQSCNVSVADGYIGTVVALPPDSAGERQSARNGEHYG